MNNVGMPTGWCRVALGELGEWSSGGTPSRGEQRFYNGAIPWLKIGDLTDGLVTEAEDHITEAGVAASAAKMIPPRCLLVAMYGSIGKLGINEMHCTTNQAIAHCRAGGGADLDFLFYQLKSLRSELVARGQGGSQRNISQGILKSIEVVLPPLNEQRRIVAKLDALMARSRRTKEALDAIPKLLEQFRQSILAAAFRGDLTKDWRAKNPDVEPAEELLKRIRIERRRKWEEAELAKMKAKGKMPGDDRWKEKYRHPPRAATATADLPPTWCWASLSEVSELQLGQRRAPEFEHEKPYPYVRAANITWRGLSLSDLMTMGFAEPDRLFLKTGDIVMSEASGSPKEVGKPALWNGEVDQCCFQATVLRVRSWSHDVVRGEWLHLALMRNALLGDFAAMAPGVGILHLTAERMRDWPIPLAPVLEQRLIGRIVDNALKTAWLMADSLEKASSQVSMLEAACLAKAFCGELVPQDPNDEPASVVLDRLRAEAAATPTKPRRKSRM